MKRKELCVTKYCRNERRGKRRVCHKCERRKVRAKNPTRYSFETLRGHSRTRGIFFNLTYDQFKTFCLETGYLKTKGPGADDMTIDRIDSSKGYEYGNIQLLPRDINSSKSNLKYASPKYLAYLRRIGEHPDQIKEMVSIQIKSKKWRPLVKQTRFKEIL